MDWKKLLTELLESGMTQTGIADEAGLTQGAISQVLNDTTGKRKGFQYEAGAKLVELHRLRVIEGKAFPSRFPIPDVTAQPAAA